MLQPYAGSAHVMDARDLTSAVERGVLFNWLLGFVPGAVGHVHQGGEGDVAPLEEIPQGVGGADDHGPLKAVVGDREFESCHGVGQG